MQLLNTELLLLLLLLAAAGPDLSVQVNGLKLPNPFVIGSGPPGTNYQVMKKAFDEGWGAVICKTLSLDSSKVRADCARQRMAVYLHLQ
jgi:dihydropyrimidine dehydrogenase (NADP+)